MIQCDICEQLKDHVVYTTSDKVGGHQLFIFEVRVCQRCMDLMGAGKCVKCGVVELTEENGGLLCENCWEEKE